MQLYQFQKYPLHCTPLIRMLSHFWILKRWKRSVKGSSASLANNFAHFIIMFTFGISHSVYAQYEGNNWYFGNTAGITFNSGIAEALTNGQMIALEGCASMSTSKGRLLFYTDGMSVWDSTHTKTPNGNNSMNGSYNSTQSAIIIPHPDSSGSYYIFTTDLQGGGKGLCYSEFKMRLNSGKGDLVSSTLNKQLLPSTCERLAATKHANGRDYWVFANQYGSDSLYVYLVTPKGVTKSTQQNTGINVLPPFHGGTLGYMKVSPDGTKLAFVTNGRDTMVVADFNPNTGLISNIWHVQLNDGYGLEFSAKSSYLYAASGVNFVIYQFNAKASSVGDLIASQVRIDSTKNTFSPLSGSLQLGPDGKIYTNWAYHYYLGVIHAPDSAGLACRPQQNFVYLKGKRTLYGLPGFISNYFDRNQQIHFTRNCVSDTTFFWPTVTKDLDSVRWQFGDTISGNKNYATSINQAYHIYKKTGKYQVKLRSYFKTYTDSTIINLTVKAPKPFIGNDTLICNMFSLKLKPEKRYLSYRWNTGDTLGAITVSKSGIYILQVRDSLNCLVADTMRIQNPQVKAGFNVDDTMQCLNNNVFQFLNNSLFTNDSFGSVLWKISDNTMYTNPGITKSFSKAGTFNIKLTATSAKGCKDSISKQIAVNPNPQTGFYTNNDSQCFAGHQFTLNDTSKITSGSIQRILWNFGDGTHDTSQTRGIKIFAKDTAYTIQLITTSNKGCHDTSTRTVTLWPDPVADFNVKIPVQCFKFNRFHFENKSNIKSGMLSKYTWDFGDNTYDSSRHVTQKNYRFADSFDVKLSVISEHGCKDSTKKNVRVLPNVKIDFSINKSSQCFKDHLFNFTNLSTLTTGTFKSFWRLGDGDTSHSGDVISKKYSKDSTYEITLITISNHGCRDTLRNPIVIHPDPEAKFTVNKRIQCLKQNSFDFLNTSSVKGGSISSNAWNLGDGDTKGSLNVLNKNYTQADSFKIELRVTSAMGCKDSASLYVKTLAMDAGFDVFVDSTSCPVYTFISTGNNTSALLWNLDDKESGEKLNMRSGNQFDHTFSKEGKYKPCLIKEFNNSCRDTVCKEIEVKVSRNLNIPNVFTPGFTDNLNDVFDIETLGVEDYHLIIFNRWGQLVFESKIDGIRDDGNNWTGKTGKGDGLFPDGTYFYILNYKFKCNENFSRINGAFTLIGKN